MRPIFVMVKCDPGTAYDVAARALDTDRGSRARAAYSTSGTYDLLVKCNLPSDADVGRFVTGRLQTLPNVKDTLTIITFNAFT